MPHFHEGGTMARRFGASWLHSLAALGVVLWALPVPADVVWKVADVGPRVPDEVEVLGDESRTIAFGPEGDWELHGLEWKPVPLRTTEFVGRERTLFFANGRFGALTQSWETCLVQLFALRGDTWTRVWSGTTCWTPVRSEERLYVSLVDPFVGCDCETGPGAAQESRRFLSVSLVDGAVREEAPLPWCAGTLFVLSGKVHLIATPPGCGGPSARKVTPLSSGTTYAFYRLDEGGWTRLPDWNLPPEPLFSTPNSLWVLVPTSSWEYVFRVLTSAGLSEPVSVPRVMESLVAYPSVLEWNGRTIAVDRESRGNIYILEGNALVRLVPEAPLDVPYRGPRVSVAGNRLFASAEGWDVQVLGGGTWSPTSGLVGRAGATEYLMGETKTFALRGHRIYRRDAAGWTRLPNASGTGYSWSFSVWKDRPVVSDRHRSELGAAPRARPVFGLVGRPRGASWIQRPAPRRERGSLCGRPPGNGREAKGRPLERPRSLAAPDGGMCAGAPRAFRQAAGSVYIFSSHTLR